MNGYAAILFLLSMAPQVFAETGAGRPIETINIGGSNEICEIPWHAKGFYSKKNIKKEKELCAIDFYESGTYQIKPKLNSTNPGVLVFDTASGEKIAKYKQSISCSYTPALIGYYHLSRLLGTNNVPISVYRTMDSDEHGKIVRRGVARSKGLINQLWRQFRSWKNKAESGRGNAKTNRLYHNSDPSNRLIGGALSVNPRGEGRYKAIMGLRGGHGGPYKRISNFLAGSLYVPVKSSQSMTSRYGRTFNKVAPKLQLYSDITGMIVMDYLMSQQDRYGNQHYEDYYLVKTTQGKLKKLKKKKWSRNGAVFTHNEKGTSLDAEDFVSSKILLLKDNDCGVIKDNHAEKVSAHKTIKHLDYKLYQKLLNFNRNIQAASSEYSLIFYSTSKFTQRDLDGLRKRSKLLTNHFYKSCKGGKLKLDLGLKDFVKGVERTIEDCELNESLFTKN